MTTNATTLSLRLPRSLKAALEKVAAADGTSMNQFLVMAAAEKLAAIHTAETFFAQRRERGDVDKALVFRQDLLEKSLKNKHKKYDLGYILEPVKYPGPDLKELSDDFKRFFETHCVKQVRNEQENDDKAHLLTVSSPRKRGSIVLIFIDSRFHGNDT